MADEELIENTTESASTDGTSDATDSDRFQGSNHQSSEETAVINPTSVMIMPGLLHGRQEILVNTETITEANVVELLQQCVQVHEQNMMECEYLYKYYCGIQPILDRVKEVRPEINNKVVVNHAKECVDFKNGYVFGDPIVYAGKGGRFTDEVNVLNDYMAALDKPFEDLSIGYWMHIVGEAPRFVRGVPKNERKDGDPPFEISTLDPRYSFVVRYNGLKKTPVMGVKFVDALPADSVDQNTGISRIYSVYTKDRYFEIQGGQITRSERNGIGEVPMIEYPLNMARLGAFEPCIPVLDAMNLLESNRMDGIEQFIQSILLFHNVDISASDVERLQAMGAISYKDADPSMVGDVRYITPELSQQGSQTLKEDLYESFLIISGMPNRNGGSSTSDTGSAVIYRDGWSAAESRAKETERWFIRSEKEMLRIILKILRETDGIEMNVSDVEIKPTRTNYENLSTKVTALTAMLGQDKIAPRLAFVQSGMFADPEAAYAESMEYYKENQTKVDEQRVQTNALGNTGDTEIAEEGERSGTEGRERQNRSNRNQTAQDL